MSEFETEYFTIGDPSPSHSGLTFKWPVFNDLYNLGEITWNAAWRRYVFEPMPKTFFDAKCMRELAEFCDRKTVEHDAKSRSGKDKQSVVRKESD